MLPRLFPPFPHRCEFDIFAQMYPAKEVGGDFYDFFLIGEKKLCFVVGDVSGKGVPAALFMVITKALLKTEALRGVSPVETLENVNKMLAQDNDNCMFVTVLLGIMDIDTGEIEFGNAGHNPPLLYRKGKEYDYCFFPKGFVLGPMLDVEFGFGKIKLEKDDVLYLYTDGVTEAMNRKDELYNEDRLKSFLNTQRGNSIKDIIYHLRTDVDLFADGADQSDDITMLALTYKKHHKSSEFIKM
jgi:sigma-B regulation protein RsbU (phosphoserine phosphatase)